MKKSILISSVQVTAFMFAIKLLGIVKQMVIAYVAGANDQTDVYFVVSGVITALCTIAFSCVSVSLVSMYTERLLTVGRVDANRLINAVLKCLLPCALLIAFLFAIGAPVVSTILVPTYSGEKRELLIQGIRIMSVMFVFSCYYQIVDAILVTEKLFLPGKIQNLLQNLFVVIAALLFYRRYGIASLFYSFVLAGVVQCVQISFRVRKLFLPAFHMKIHKEREAIRKLFRLALPLLIGNAIYEINDIVDKQIATGLGTGNVSVLSYGASVNEVVVSLIVSSVTTVMFSHFATWAAEKRIDEIEASLTESIELLIFMIVPALVICLSSSDLIVKVLYGRGSFDQIAVEKSSGVVSAYACGFLFQAVRANLVRVYYAFQNTRTPMINGAVSVFCNIILSILLSRLIGIAGVALATSISALIAMLFLLPGVKKYIPNFDLLRNLPEYGKMILAGMITFVFSAAFKGVGLNNVYIFFLLEGLLIVFSYLILAKLLKINSFGKLFALIKK